MLQLSWAGIVSGACSALQHQLCSNPPIPQAHPCSVAHGGTSPSPLPPPDWAGCTVCPENHHSLLTKMMGPPLVGHWLKVGPAIYSPCCSSVREGQ